VFEGLEPDSARGIAARRVIRKRLRAFDGTEPAAALGNYGDADNREWRQYFLPDKNTDAELRCPFHAGRRPASVAAAAPVPAPLHRPGSGPAERRRALHRRMLVEAGLAGRRGGPPASAPRGPRDKPSHSPAAAYRVWLTHR